MRSTMAWLIADCARYDSLRRTNSHGTHRGSGPDGTMKPYGMLSAYVEIMGVAIKLYERTSLIIANLAFAEWPTVCGFA